MPKLKITSAEGNTTEEFMSPAEMRQWFSRGERQLLDRYGSLRQPVGADRYRLIEVIPSAPPARGGASQVGGLYYLMVSETNGAEYVMRYSAAEMADEFSPEQRADLEKGAALVVANCRFVDMVAAARTIRD